MVKTLAIASPKGGVGKTTLSLNLSLALAEQGIRTLLVDTDMQGGVGLSLQGDLNKQPGVVNLYTNNGAPTASEAVRTTRNSALSLLPFGQLDSGWLERWNDVDFQSRVIDGIQRDLGDAYDLIIFDSPAGLSGITHTLLTKVQYVLVPLQTEPLAFRALPSLVAMLRSINERSESGSAAAQLAGVVLTMVRFKEEYSLAIAQDAWELLPPDVVLEAYVPKDPVFVEASAKGVPVGLLSRKRPPVASVFASIASEVERRLGLDTAGDTDEPIPLFD